MDLRSLSLGERIAAVSGAALFVFLFVTWLEGSHAWELFGIVDILLAILALTAVALPVARAVGAEPPLRPSNRTILVRVGAVALVLILAYFLEAVGSAQVGLWLSVLAAAGILYGAVTMPVEAEKPPHRRERPRRPLAEEGLEEPPPGMERWRETVGAPEDEEVEPRPPAGARRARTSEPGREPRRPTAPRGQRPRSGVGEPRPEGGVDEPEPDERELRGRRRPPDIPSGEDR